MEASLLAGLNPAQRAAVTSTVPVLQVLAPPGSGKTKTLTSRVAHLLAHRDYNPQNVICCTFTIKASREMRERLRALVGEQLESKLILGTFHSVCRRYLAAYGTKIGIGKGFGIADSSDSKSIVKRIIKKHDIKLEPTQARSKISWNKARFRTVASLEAELAKSKEPAQSKQDIITVFREYEDELKNNNLLDYDDLLLRCVDLLRAQPTCVANVEALLIDEFQDTNIVQYELMKLFASARNHITIVGDPDQSIYGFRSAEIENLKRMQAYYRDAVVINLEENYRSGGAILKLAQDVIDQDTARPDKKLKSTHCHGALPVLRRLPNSFEEGLWIASEVRRIIASTGGLIGHADIAVLIRSGYLSSRVEKAFTNAGIPYRMVGGTRFFDRAEIRLIVDYLRTISHPDNNAAFLAIINVPSRKIGEKAIESLAKLSEEHELPIFRVVQRVLAGSLVPEKKLSKPSEQDLSRLVNIINKARDKMEDMPPAQVPGRLVEYVVEALHLQAYLQKKYKDDYEDRIENVQELIAYASDMTVMSTTETLPTVEGIAQEQIDQCQEALDQFLANIVLSSEVEQDDKDDPKPRVTISTIHSAKGLEWPVVFIPSVYDGSIPHSRAEDTDEERRLLYVAITRAQALLNISFPLIGSRDQGSNAHDLTPFLPESLHYRTANKAPLFTDSIIADIARILRRETPSSADIAQGVTSISSSESLEDDRWPLDGRPALGPEQNIMTGGWIVGIGGSQLADSSFQSATGITSYQTTMTSARSFSPSNTSMNAGFTTAGQQMRSINTMHQGHTLQDSSAPPAPSSSGPRGIQSFFPRRPSAAEAARQAWSARPSQSAPVNKSNGGDRPGIQSQSFSQSVPKLPTMPSTSIQHGASDSQQLLPQLGSHRLPTFNAMGRAAAPGRTLTGQTGSVGVKRPRPPPLGELSPNRSKRVYHFLSSSPTQELFDENGEITIGTKEDFDIVAKARKQDTPSNNVQSQLDSSVKVASTERSGFAPPRPHVDPKKRQLGVRGSFVPWNERKHK
jgi:DNA helicase II / ATP-dependent DNA helicase PcrA